jgi:ComF family protein
VNSLVSTTFKKSIRFFEQLLYPLKCLKCGAYIDPDMVVTKTLETCFCDECMESGFHPIDSPFCTKCGVKFHNSFDENHICEACLKTPLKIGRARAAAEYTGIIKDAIPAFKYNSKLSLAKVFEQLLFETFIKHYAKQKIDIIMPIPLHKKKLKERGFNQAFFLIRNFKKLYAQNFKKSCLIKIDISSLVRIKRTQPQTGFDIQQRKKNLANAFKVVNENAIKNKNILLIDDVLTTGTTCNEAAQKLLKHGAKKVDALVLART